MARYLEIISTMGKYSEIIKGLQLFMELDGDRYAVAAKLDELYVGPLDCSFTADQLEQLAKWGWRFCSYTGHWKKFV